MKALVQTDVEQLELLDVDTPEPGPGEALVRVAAVGVCGSDMHAFLGHDERRPVPIVLGHEAAGTVVGGPHDGRRVAVNPLVSCGACEACLRGRENLCANREVLSLPPRAGAFAQFVVVPEANLLPVPDDVPLERAALVEPLACAWHAARLGRRAVDLALAGLPCAVIGGGAIGLGAALALREGGADDVTLVEPNPLRREQLAAMAGFRTVDVGDPPEASAALVIDAVGLADTRARAGRLVRPGGVVVHVGLGEAEGGLDMRRVTLGEITVIGSYCYTARDFRDAGAAAFEGRLGPLDWTETRPLADGAQAFADIREGRAAPKILLVPPEATVPEKAEPTDEGQDETLPDVAPADILEPTEAPASAES